jgi:WD40 repeat protein
MRSLRLAVTPLLALCLVASCSGQDTGLLDLTLNADTTNPLSQAVAIDLIGSGGVHRSYPGKFPPDGATSLRLEYPDLPTGTITFTVQTLDSKGCVLGESPAPFAVAIKAGAKATAATTIQRSSKPCGDGGGQVQGLDAAVDTVSASEPGGLDAGAGLGDSPGDTATGVDVGVDAPAVDAQSPTIDLPLDTVRPLDTPAADMPADRSVVDSSPPLDTPADSFAAIDTSAGTPDVPVATVPTIVSLIASPATISAGSSATLTAIFKNATGSSIDHGIGSVTSGNGVGTGALSATTTYKLTVTDASGASASQTVTVTVVPLPSITSFAALLPTIAVGTLTQLTGTFSGGTGSIDQGIGPVSSGAPVPTSVLTANTTFTLTVTNVAGDSVTKQAAVTVSSAVGTGVFTATGAMTVARSNHTATLLPNGKVLMAGGSADTRAELYDPSTGTFALTGTMHISRNAQTATLLSNGKVLIIGGGSDASVELYDPVAGTFSLIVTASDSWGYHTATALSDGRVLVAGGMGTSSGPLASAEVYDPGKSTFTPTGSMSNPRLYATASILLNGQVLVAGGLNNTNVPPKGDVATADLWDPSTGLFKPTGLLLYGRTSHIAVPLLSGEVLIVGGETDSGPALYAELYDPSKGSFSVSGMESDERYRHTATLLPNGRVLVAGGNGNMTSVDLYDRASGKFTSTGALTVERQLHTATLLPNGSVLVAGGSGSDQSPTNSTELYF